ncbi:MAG: germination protein YpeB, partial [Clostridia bacterium]|nr:germination protein YpeB [Clostridia bacterium]
LVAGVAKKAPAKKAPAKKREKSKKTTVAAKRKKEKEQAKKRVEAALLKEERKAKKAEMKEARKARRAELLATRKAQQAETRKLKEQRAQKAREKRLARKDAMKEKAAQRKAEREARKELLRNESKAQRSARLEKERMQKAAERKEKREKAYNLKLERRDARLKKREQRLKDRQHRRETRRTPGFGGWLAAVISLGAVCLALTSVLTYGALNLTKANGMITTGYRGNLYELVGIMDEVDVDLNKARVASGKEEQEKLLTDLLVQARLAESNLEKMPFSSKDDENMTAFLNRTAFTAERMLEKLRSGEGLSEADAQKIETLYRTNHEIRSKLDELVMQASDKDLDCMLKGKKNKIVERFKEMERTAMPDHADKVESPFEGALKRSEDGKKKEISTMEAEEQCRSYFKDFAVEKIEYAGETISQKINAYNFFLTDKDGVKIFAEISKDGKLVEFDYFKPCKKTNFDLDRCKDIAQDFLSSLGYENMKPVWMSEGGATVTLHFVYEQDGVLVHSDMVKVKICQERGVVSGLDASAFLKNHRGRGEMNFKITAEQGKNTLNKNLTVLSESAVLIPAQGKERTAYEFICSYDDTQYFIYVDGNSGKEIAIFIVQDSALGRSLL